MIGRQISKAALMFAIFLGCASLSRAQRPALEFDVASVKPVKDCSGGQRFRNLRGSLEVLNMEPTTLIRNAYRLAMDEQLSGYPAWADEECFAIEGKADDDAEVGLSEAKARNLLRLQSLLASRFQLRFHFEERVEQGYVLAVGKNGPKLKPTATGSAHISRQGRGTLVCTSCSIEGLTIFLSSFLKRPIQNDTGIGGLYDFDLAFEPLAADSKGDSRLPSLFTVLAEMGLKLKPGDVVLPTLVVDHIERPSEN